MNNSFFIFLPLYWVKGFAALVASTALLLVVAAPPPVLLNRAKHLLDSANVGEPVGSSRTRVLPCRSIWRCHFGRDEQMFGAE